MLQDYKEIINFMTKYHNEPLKYLEELKNKIDDTKRIRRFNILKDYLMDTSIKELSIKYIVTVSRIRQIVAKTMEEFKDIFENEFNKNR